MREGQGLGRQELADKSGLPRQMIRRWEAQQEPSWETLLKLVVGVMGYDPEDLDGLLFAVSRAYGLLPRVPASPIVITEEELRGIRRVTGPLGRAATDSQEDLMIRALRAEKVREARAEAEQVCKVILQAKGKMRRLFVEEKTHQTWAVAERLCELSRQAAGRSAKLALELANLARRVAELMPGEEAWRARVLGYCLAFLAYAWLVAEERSRPASSGAALKKAEEIFLHALDLWRQGEVGDPERILPVWRLLDFEASLRRQQRLFVDALRLHEEARAAAPRDAWGQVLVNKAVTCDRMADADGAVRVLREALSLVEEGNQLRLRFQAGCLMAAGLCQLGHYKEAEDWVLRARASGIELRDEAALDQVRRISELIAAGRGQVVRA